VRQRGPRIERARRRATPRLCSARSASSCSDGTALKNTARVAPRCACRRYDTRHEDSLARLLRGVDADGVRLEAEFGFCWRGAGEALDRRFRSCARVRSQTPRRRLGERRRPGLRSCSRMSDRRRRSKLDGQIVKIARRPARTQGPGVSPFPHFATRGVRALGRARLRLAAWARSVDRHTAEPAPALPTDYAGQWRMCPLSVTTASIPARAAARWGRHR
jgi:hypothetical protein